MVALTAMECPLCRHEDSRVLRTVGRDSGIARSRQCMRCGHRWPTLEIPADRANRLERLESAARAILEPGHLES